MLDPGSAGKAVVGPVQIGEAVSDENDRDQVQPAFGRKTLGLDRLLTATCQRQCGFFESAHGVPPVIVFLDAGLNDAGQASIDKQRLTVNEIRSRGGQEHGSAAQFFDAAPTPGGGAFAQPF